MKETFSAKTRQANEDLQEPAARLTGLILRRAGANKYVSVREMRRWLLLEFGLSSKLVDLGPSETGWLEGRRRRCGCRIVVNLRLPPHRQIRIFLHELAEWMAVEQDAFVLGLETAPPPDPAWDPAGRRHLLALMVEDAVACQWGLDSAPSSFSLYDRLRIASPFGGCSPKYTFESGQPDADFADPLDDACL